MEDSPEDSRLDQVAAVVLHSLVEAAPTAMTLEQIVRAEGRDVRDAVDRELIGRALARLLQDGLVHQRCGRFAPTRAAIRAAQLSF